MNQSPGSASGCILGMSYFGICGVVTGIEIEGIDAPEAPDVVGPDNGCIGYPYSFSASATDPNGNDICIQFEWGDGTTSGWSEPVANGVPVTMLKEYSQMDAFSVRARARDTDLRISNWSVPHDITIQDAAFCDLDFCCDQSIDDANLNTVYTFELRLGNTSETNTYMISVSASGAVPSQSAFCILPESEELFTIQMTIASDSGTAISATVTASDNYSEWEETITISITTKDNESSFSASKVQLALDPGIIRIVPNPGNPTTQISYYLSSSDNVRLRVYNILGREVVKLVDWVQPCGAHSATFDGSNLPSGIYFVNLETTDFIDTRKIVVLK